jgi:hypothetical protein
MRPFVRWNSGDSPVLCGAEAEKMSESDLWEKALACAKAVWASSDPKKRAVLVYLGEFWLNLARTEPFRIDDRRAPDIAVMEQIHAELIGINPTFH